MNGVPTFSRALEWVDIRFLRPGPASQMAPKNGVRLQFSRQIAASHRLSHAQRGQPMPKFVTIGYGDQEVETTPGPFMKSPLPVAGFAIIEAADMAEAIAMVSQTPCAVAHGVVEVWPLEQP